jgi:hypothetical protein
MIVLEIRPIGDTMQRCKVNRNRVWERDITISPNVYEVVPWFSSTSCVEYSRVSANLAAAVFKFNGFER